jgi:hypothetical protein
VTFVYFSCCLEQFSRTHAIKFLYDSIDKKFRSFFTLHRTHDPSKEYINLLYEFGVPSTGHIKNIFQYMDKCDWNKARELAIINITNK